MGKVKTQVQEDEEGVQQMGVRVKDEGMAAVAAPPEAAASPPALAALAEFAVAGDALVGEFRCADCGYGAVVQRVLPSCPMCGGTIWERRGPLARPRAD